MAIKSSAAFDVQEEPFEVAIDGALATLNATRRHVVTRSRFEWLYRQNPDGEAVIWTVRDAGSGDVVGFTACLPRRMIAHGRSAIAWNGADFSIRPTFRTLGPAVKLRRAARLDIDKGRADFLYAHPNDTMAKIHARVGHQPIGTMIRLAKPLRPSIYIGEKTGWPIARIVARYTLDPGARVIDGTFRRRLRHRIEFQSTPRFDEQFDALFQRHRPTLNICGIRDSQYLNWRYAANPLYETDALLAWSGDQLEGFLLYCRNDRTLSIKDVFPPDPEVAADLLAVLVRHGYGDYRKSASVTLLASHPLRPVFASCGFSVRPETSQMYGYVPDSSQFESGFLDAANWLISVGDRDV